MTTAPRRTPVYCVLPARTLLDVAGPIEALRGAKRSGFASSRQLRRAWGRFNTMPPSAAQAGHSPS